MASKVYLISFDLLKGQFKISFPKGHNDPLHTDFQSIYNGPPEDEVQLTFLRQGFYIIILKFIEFSTGDSIIHRISQLLEIFLTKSN